MRMVVLSAPAQRNAAAWLNAAATRLCLHELESARKRRERYPKFLM